MEAGKGNFPVPQEKDSTNIIDEPKVDTSNVDNGFFEDDDEKTSTKDKEQNKIDDDKVNKSV